jgi:hypothetical protein
MLTVRILVLPGRPQWWGIEVLTDPQNNAAEPSARFRFCGKFLPTSATTVTYNFRIAR